MPDQIKYKEGYKYQLAEEYVFATDITGYHIVMDFIQLLSDGTLIIAKGYAWDGASGPTYDSKSSMRASMLHDALYQLFGEHRDLLKFRDYADTLLYNTCVEDGMWSIRAWIWKKGVNWFGSSAAEEDDTILLAP